MSATDARTESPSATGWPARVVAVVRRVPFTAAVVVVMLVLGVVTGSLWSALEDKPLFEKVAYGLPAFQDGQWWTVVTGALFALTPAQYVPVAGGFAILVGFAEYRMGTRRTAIAAISLQAVAVVAAAALLWLLTATTDWAWAIRIADDRDVGFSAGALGALAACTAAVRPPWRGRLRLVVSLYALLFFLYVGVLWDLEHLLGVFLGLALGPVLMGHAPRIRLPRASRHEWRSVAALTFALAAVVRLMLWFIPADGPLGATSDDDSTWSVLITAAVSLLLANGLRKGSRVAWRWGIGITGFFLGLLLLGGIAVTLDPVENDLDLGDSLPAFAVDLALWVLQFLVLLLGRGAFHSPSGRKLRKLGPLDGDEREVAVDLLHHCGGTSLSWMTTWEANHWYVPRDPDNSAAGFQAYQLHQGAAIGLGDPVAPTPQARAGVLDSYVGFWEAQGRVPCLFSASQEVADWAADRGWLAVVVAEEAVIDLPDLEFKGKSWQDIRTALNRAGKEDVTYRSGRLAEMPRGVQNQVRAISSMWTDDKALPEMGFTLGGVEEALDPEVVVGLAVDSDATVHGITSWLPAYGPDGRVVGRTLDVMRRLPDGFRPTTEFLIASACLEFQEAGCAYVSLSGAPLAHSGASGVESPLDPLLGWLGATLEPLYGFRSLESFKQKFKPRPAPLYLVFSDESHLARIGLALTRAYLPDTPLRKLAVVGLKAGRT
jgi:lysylphosphatidylglycerol synthetase-like protein (DUF2156 family)